MKQLNILYALIKADFLERVRRTSFWVVVLLGCGLGYLFLPPTDAETLMLAFGPWRSVYNASWVGISFGILAVTILPLFAFFAIKQAVTRDRQTRVGQIIATTLVSKPLYLLGKWLSNLAVLTILLLIMSAMALFMQLYRGEVLTVQFGPLLAPLWLMGWPVMALLAAVAIVFEILPVLRTSVGNVIFFFGWLLYLSLSALPGLFSTQIGMLTPWNDPLGLTRPLAALQTFAQTVDPSYNGHFNLAGASYGRLPTVHTWQGMSWTADIALERLVWLAVSTAVILTTSIFFDRFDPSRSRPTPSTSRFWPRRTATPPATEPAPLPTYSSEPISLARLSQHSGRINLASLIRAELKLHFLRQPWWWYTIAVGATLFSLIAPLNKDIPAVVLCWLWPLLIWATLGTRESEHRTANILFSAPEPLRSQFWASWLAGVIVALAATGLLSMRLLIAGAVLQMIGMWIGALFVPALALACGIWSGTPRLFQLVYLLLWITAAAGNRWLDFMAYSPQTAASGIPLLYLLLVCASLAIAYLGRYQSLQR